MEWTSEFRMRLRPVSGGVDAKKSARLPAVPQCRRPAGFKLTSGSSGTGWQWTHKLGNDSAGESAPSLAGSGRLRLSEARTLAGAPADSPATRVGLGVGIAAAAAVRYCYFLLFSISF